MLLILINRRFVPVIGVDLCYYTLYSISLPAV